MTADRQPWWLRALEPLRSEAAMFQVVVRVAAVALALIAIVLVIRALS